MTATAINSPAITAPKVERYKKYVKKFTSVLNKNDPLKKVRHWQLFFYKVK